MSSTERRDIMLPRVFIGKKRRKREKSTKDKVCVNMQVLYFLNIVFKRDYYNKLEGIPFASFYKLNSN